MTQIDRTLIFVVEDNLDQAELITYALKQEGFHCTCFGNAELALDGLRAADVHPSLILLDYVLPGTPAATFVSKVREQNPEIQFILVSAVTQLSIKAAFLHIDKWLEKPFDLDEHVRLTRQLSKHVS